MLAAAWELKKRGLRPLMSESVERGGRNAAQLYRELAGVERAARALVVEPALGGGDGPAAGAAVAGWPASSESMRHFNTDDLDALPVAVGDRAHLPLPAEDVDTVDQPASRK